MASGTCSNVHEASASLKPAGVIVQWNTAASACRALFLDGRLSAWDVRGRDVAGRAVGVAALSGTDAAPCGLPLSEPWATHAADAQRFFAGLDQLRAVNVLYDHLSDVRRERDGMWSARCPGPGAPHRLAARPETVHGRPGVTVSCPRCGDGLVRALRARCGPGVLVNIVPGPVNGRRPQ